MVLEKAEGKLPEGWKWVKLGEVCDVVNGYGFPHPLQGRKNLPYPFVKVSDMNADGAESFVSTAANTVDSAILAELRAKTYPAGTVIFPKVGGALLTNKKRVLAVEATFDNNVMGLVPLNVESGWLFAWIQTVDLRELANTQALPSIRQSKIASLLIPLPPLPEQKRIAAILTEQMAAVDKARVAVEAQLEAAKALPAAYLRESFANGGRKTVRLSDGLEQVSKGIGSPWSNYPVLGATRAGLAPAKESVGKTPERYKFVDEGTIFYNPMRILLGSIAMIDEGDSPGITSPDYVAFKGKRGKIHFRWFYYWLRSQYGEQFIKSMSRGAVRERMLFKRLADAAVNLPSWEAQQEAAEKMKHIRALQDLIEDQLKEINALPEPFLRRAFNGEL